MKVVNRSAGARFWPFLVVAILIAASAGGYYLWQARQKAALAAESPTYETSSVRQGDLLVDITGQGTLIAANQVDLSFPTSGVVAELNVQVGDKVKAGDILAKLDGIDALKVAVDTAQLDLNTAQKTLDDLQADPNNNLAKAMQTLTTAQSDYANAEKNLRQKGVGRCSDNTITDDYMTWLLLQNRVNEWESYLYDKDTGYGQDYILHILGPLRKSRDEALATLNYCRAYTTSEIEGSEADLKMAQANLDQAQAAYDKIKSNGSEDIDAVALAKANVNNAQYVLDLAQKALDGATLVAPIDGVVLSVAANKGDRVDTSTFISLADVSKPTVQVYIDETDLQNMKVGCDAQVVFDSIPNRTFTGKVTQVTPQLTTTRGFSTVQGLVELTDATTSSNKSLPLGLSASIDVICQKVTNVLLAPVEALQSAENNQYFVYILNSAGKPEKRDVQVGLIGYSYAEIRSGLKVGDRVITSSITGK
jgi:HlyD family secretion protein